MRLLRYYQPPANTSFSLQKSYRERSHLSSISAMQMATFVRKHAGALPRSVFPNGEMLLR